MNLKGYRMMVAGGVCTALALAVLGGAIWSYKQQSRELSRAYRGLARLNARNPFPSAENVAQATENLEQLENRIGELETLLQRDPFPQNAVDASDFSARAQGMIERFKRRAAAAGITLPSGMEAGFSQYASGGALPELAHVPRLSRQLYSVEKVADVLIQGGVSSVEMLARDEFEGEGGDASNQTSRRRGRRMPVAAEGPEGVGFAVQGEGRHPIERIRASFTATEDGVWRVLDLLASAPHFMVLADFRSKTETEILSYDPEAMAKDSKGGAATAKFLSGGLFSGDKALSRQERIIAGDETIRVVLMVEVYNFSPQTEASE